MAPTITLITLTSDRPEAFALCERWMSRQDYPGEIDWLVIDDGRSPVSPSLGQQHVRRSSVDDPLESFYGNLQSALQLSDQAESLLFIEDDVYYSSDYLSFMIEMLAEHDVVGEAHCRDYDVHSGRYRICTNNRHASLCQTGIRGTSLDLFRKIVKQNRAPDVDRRFWTAVGHETLRQQLLPESKHSVNIKGLPGKRGFIGHDIQTGPLDSDATVLQQWCGDDAELYVRFREL